MKRTFRCKETHCTHKCKVDMDDGEPDYCLIEGWEHAAWREVKKRKVKNVKKV